jgi:hypothetical protein
LEIPRSELQSDAVGVRYLCIPGLARAALSFKKGPAAAEGRSEEGYGLKTVNRKARAHCKLMRDGQKMERQRRNAEQ